MRKNTGNKAKISVIALTLVACLMVAGVSAYFTDADTVTNTFTIGKISLDLQEPNWDPDIPDSIVPEQEFAKDPQIVNDGINDEYVFLEIIVPYANVKTANENGTVNNAADTQLFTWGAVNAGWSQVGTATKDTVNETFTYVYAYTGADANTMEALKANANTGALFNHVEFANLAEDQAIAGEKLNIIINAYGIQTTNINDGADDTLTGENKDGATAPQYVWEVIKNANPSTAQGTENVKTDAKTNG